MLLSLIYFLPCIVSLLWFFSFVLKRKNERQRLFCYAEGASVMFYALIGIYFFPEVDYSTMVRMEAVGIPFGLIFPAFVVAYLYMHCYGRKLSDMMLFALLLPAIIVAVSINLLCNILGFDHAAEVSRRFASPEGLTGALDNHINHLYCIFTYDVFILLMTVYLLAMLMLCFATLQRQGYRFGDVFRFFFRGKTTTSSRAIAVMYITELLLVTPFLALGSVALSKHLMVTSLLMIAFAVIKHLIAHVEFYSDDSRQVTLYELSHLTLFSSQNMSEQEEREAVTVSSPEEPAAPTSAQIRADRRIELFLELMEVQQVWKDEDLCSAKLCEMMGVGKTTLFNVISNHYEVSLRDVINVYRIEEAKRFMKANPKATQDVVATHCGFKSAQYFNTQFKKLIGETPAMWLASRDGQQAKATL